jgi:hypothetical protein
VAGPVRSTRTGSTGLPTQPGPHLRVPTQLGDHERVSQRTGGGVCRINAMSQMDTPSTSPERR